MRAMIRFGKRDRLRFISHLDLQRFFQRAVNRTGLPIAYTQGFNPHPVMSFGSALAVGWTSEYEIIDIRLSAPMGRKRTEEAVRSALPPDLPVLEVRMVDDRHPAPMALVRMADYRVRLTGESAPAVIAQIPAFLGCEEMPVVKKTKSGEKQIDARPLVLSVEPTPNGFQTRLMLTQSQSIKPDLLLGLLCDMADVEPPRAQIHRLTLMGTDDQGIDRPLMTL